MRKIPAPKSGPIGSRCDPPVAPTAKSAHAKEKLTPPHGNFPQRNLYLTLLAQHTLYQNISMLCARIHVTSTRIFSYIHMKGQFDTCCQNTSRWRRRRPALGCEPLQRGPWFPAPSASCLNLRKGVKIMTWWGCS